MRVTLEIIEGKGKGSRYEIEGPRTAIFGRKDDPAVPFKIEDPRFSRYHFTLEVNASQCLLRDLGSRNGTYVNGQRVRQADLKHGDIIYSGETRFIVFRVTIEQSPAEAAPVPAQHALVVSMETLPVGVEFPSTASGKLCCSICGAAAPDDCPLYEVEDRRHVVYVCPACSTRYTDDRHPVPNYESLGTAGKGSLGVVYKARRVSSDKLVALKLLPGVIAVDAKGAGIFLRQMRLSADLAHPNIVPVIEMGLAGPRLWVASEFVDGPSAAELARRNGGRLPLGDAVSIVCQVLAALNHAHGRALVHRDVKPPNILVTGKPDRYVARLADLGLIKNVDEAGGSIFTEAAEKRGTLPFMPREQVLDSKSVTPACDLYAAGATLYWLLTGQFVFDFGSDPRGDLRDPFLVIVEDEPTPIRHPDPSIPPPVAAVIAKSLAPDPESRYATASEMSRALEQAVR